MHLRDQANGRKLRVSGFTQIFGLLVLYAILVPLYTWPTPISFLDRIVGGGDAFMYLWNFWWIGEGASHSVWNCPIVLHPFGANLVEHDFPLLPSLLGSQLQKLGLTVAGSYNAAVWLALWLNATTAFLLALTVTKNRFASFVSGLHFAFAPYFVGRLFGHFTLLQIYPAVLFATCLIKWDQTNRKLWATLAGISLSLTAYCSYYYAVYCVLLGGLFTCRHTRVDVMFLKRAVGKVWWAAVALGNLAFGLAVIIAVTGGTLFYLGGVPISLLGSTNPLIFSWLVLLLAFAWKYRLRIRLNQTQASTNRMLWFCVPLLTLLPLAWAMAKIYLSGEFASQRLGFKSGPAGAFVLSAFLPNVYNNLWRSAFIQKLSLTNLLEYWSVGLGWTAILTVANTKSFRESRWWTTVFCFFLLLSLGPFLRLFPGLDHGPILPFWILRFVPIIGGARIPSRAIGVALIAWAVIFALGIDRIKSKRWRFLIMVGVLAETISIPLPTSSTIVPEIYYKIHQDKQQGAILELPFGVSDGRKTWGRYPADRLFYQTVHEKAIMGGWLARIPDQIFDRYEEDSILQLMVRLQDGQDALIDENEMRKWLDKMNITWIVLDNSGGKDLLVTRITEALGPPEYSAGQFCAWHFPLREKGR